jgi:SAM-dependent methyltransferase
MEEKRSERRHWDDFWCRDRDLDEIYDNDGRIPEELSRRMDVSGRLIMEVGAATARDSARLACMGAHVIALDYSHEALGLAREAAERSGAKLMLVCGDAFNLPFRDGCIDVVFHQGVLEHFREPMPLLMENARVTRAGGTVLVDVPQTFHVYTVVKKIMIAFGAWFAGWETQFTTSELSRLLSDAGLEPVDSYGRFFSPSLAYRILREILLKFRLKLPLRPVIVPPLHRLRGRMRRRLEESPLGTAMGCIIGVFASKREDV